MIFIRDISSLGKKGKKNIFAQHLPAYHIKMGKPLPVRRQNIGFRWPYCVPSGCIVIFSPEFEVPDHFYCSVLSLVYTDCVYTN